MPLIPQQNVVVIGGSGLTINNAVAKLHDELEVYPDVRIVSISVTFSSLSMGVQLVAVVETL